MRYYSTNGAASEVTLKEAIIKGLAPDKGLYMPESIKTLPAAFFKNIGGLSLQESLMRWQIRFSAKMSTLMC